FFWVLFTSRRTYGNLWTPGIEEPTSKKIWVTALSIGSAAGIEPSHPAFLLPGQELESGNIRAFTALEPCKEDGAPCTAGTDCCSGYCTAINAMGVGVCGQLKTNDCAQVDDKCSTDDQCCQTGSHLRCLGGRCGQIFQ